MPLNKSFSEQNNPGRKVSSERKLNRKHSAADVPAHANSNPQPQQQQARQQWHRSRSHPTAISGDASAVPPPPVAVSEKTKSKLHQFQFHGVETDGKRSLARAATTNVLSRPPHERAPDPPKPSAATASATEQTSIGAAAAAVDTSDKENARPSSSPPSSSQPQQHAPSSTPNDGGLSWRALAAADRAASLLPGKSSSGGRTSDGKPATVAAAAAAGRYVNLLDASPEERVSWDGKVDANSWAALQPLTPVPARRRGAAAAMAGAGAKRKRARSSSPTSSPSAARRAEKSVSAGGLGAGVGVDGDDAKQQQLATTGAMRTPRQPDPVLDLWDRFIANGGSGGGGVAAAAATTPTSAVPHRLMLANLLAASSSPRPQRAAIIKSPADEQGGSVVGPGLRRAISCGTSWPKRRRIVVAPTEQGADSLPLREEDEDEGPGPESPTAALKNSMVSALLRSAGGEMQGGAREGDVEMQRMDQPGDAAHAVQMQLDDDAQDDAAPKVQPRDDVPGQTDVPDQPMPDAAHSPDRSDPRTAVGSDEYEDFDFDLDEDTLLELESSANQTGVGAADQGNVVGAGEGKAVHAEQGHAEEKDSFEDDDEFGDLDDDVFAAAEDLLVQIDQRQATQQQQQQQQQKPQKSPIQKKHQQFDDIYEDDDFGADFDFKAVEAAAAAAASVKTWAARQPPRLPLSSPVSGSSPRQRHSHGHNDGRHNDSHSHNHLPSSPQQNVPLPPPSQRPKIIQRYLITSVLQSTYADSAGREWPEKVLLVEADRTKEVKTIHLRQDWLDTPASVKAWVHVVGSFEEVKGKTTGKTGRPGARCVVDNDSNLLVLHPDQLVSATVVADSFSCMRRAVLQDRVKATGDATPPLVYGTILHEIFQAALLANRWDGRFLDGLVESVADKHVEDLYKIRVRMPDAREHLRGKMPELMAWADTYVASQPKPGAVVQGRNGDRATMCVNKLLDVEEHVWSPTLGLKGNIDATVQVVMRETQGTLGAKMGQGRAMGQAMAVNNPPVTRTLTVPLEIKTGRNATANHQAQTALYSLLLSERYDVDVAFGVLYYMDGSDTLRIPSVRHELRQLILQRNRLAVHVRERSAVLPEMKKGAHSLCGRCYAQTSCFVYHALADGGDGETSGLKGKFDAAVKHLTPTHREFFLRWDDLLTREEKQSWKLRRELWTLTSAEREKLGRCFGDVVIEPGSAQEDGDDVGRVNRFRYSFVKDAAATTASAFSFLDSQLAVGEPIVVSDEHGHFALALGFVTAASKRRISVAVDRRLHNARIRGRGFDKDDNQVFAGIMEVVPEGATQQQQQHATSSTPSQLRTAVPQLRYRLDKDEFSNGMATVRNSLVQVMADGPFGSAAIRRLVVDLEPPRFDRRPTQGRGANNNNYVPADNSLNVDQRLAIEKVMSAQDYALVLGMPGTGKTTTVAHIIRALVAGGKSVLLASYTHSAVDNILLKLRGDGISILRLGAVAKVHPEVREFATLAAAAPGGGFKGTQPQQNQNQHNRHHGPTTTTDPFDMVRAAWHDPPIVATTCLGTSHALFAERVFDYCIVDEASQITLPVCLGPIRLARRFVLVGDHNQLPPLVQSDEARRGGLDVSLFKLLSDRHPAAVASLEHQYRMNQHVMALSNDLIYGGRLKCGTVQVRDSRLSVPRMDRLADVLHWDAQSIIASAAAERGGGVPRSLCAWGGGPQSSSPSCWLRDLLDPAAAVRFVNTDTLVLPSSWLSSGGGGQRYGPVATSTNTTPGALEEARGARIVNRGEARVVAQLVTALITAGVAPRDVGVMTHYRSQLTLLRHAVARARVPAGTGVGRDGLGCAATRAPEGVEDVEMHTADRFQGRDKEVVVVSLVRSNGADGHIGELLRDWRRINVAFTRAKTKLLVVGSRQTLKASGGNATKSGGSTTTTFNNDNNNNNNTDQKAAKAEGAATTTGATIGGGADMLARFVALMERRGWVYDLPPDALGAHRFDEAVDNTAATNTNTAAAAAQALSARTTATTTTVAAAEPQQWGGLEMEDGCRASWLDAAGKADNSSSTTPQKRAAAPMKQPKRRVGGTTTSTSNAAEPRRSEEDEGKENVRPTAAPAAPAAMPKKAKLSDRVLLGGKPVLRDIMNEMMDGAY